MIGKALDNLTHAKDSKKIPLFYANDGLVWISKNNNWYPKDSGPKDWIKNVTPFVRRRISNQKNDAIVNEGCLAQWVGGCCRVGPDLIKELADFIDSTK